MKELQQKESRRRSCEGKEKRCRSPRAAAGGLAGWRASGRAPLPTAAGQACTHLVRIILASVTSPLAEKCSLSRLSSTCLGRFLTQTREVASAGWAAPGASPPPCSPASLAILLVSVC